jgi:hypothetical protein
MQITKERDYDRSSKRQEQSNGTKRTDHQIRLLQRIHTQWQFDTIPTKPAILRIAHGRVVTCQLSF